MSNLDMDPDEWLKELFEWEYCDECRGDERHHDAIPFMGNWFARCRETGEGTCRHCGLAIERGTPHPETDPDLVEWFHVEHGGITCGSASEDTLASPK